jgi:hypothetical protein
LSLFGYLPVIIGNEGIELRLKLLFIIFLI